MKHSLSAFFFALPKKNACKKKGNQREDPFENPRQKAEQLCSISASKSKVQVYPDAALAVVINLSARTSLQLLRSSPVEYDRAVKHCRTPNGVVSAHFLYPRADMNGTVC